MEAGGKNPPRTKFQHYVPRFYLEKFCNGEGRVWTYDKHLDKAYCTRPEGTGGERYFYDDAMVDEAAGIPQFLEKAFCEMEGLGALVLNRWLEKLYAGTYFRIYPEEREIFARFLALQLVRSPHQRSFAIQNAAMLEKIKFREFLKTKDPEAAEIPFEVRFDPGIEPLVHSMSILDSEALEDCVAIIQGHIWVVSGNKTGMPFLTSDNPITRHAHKKGFGLRQFTGYSSLGVELIFPLSPWFTLSMLERKFHKKFDRLDGRLHSVPLIGPNIEHVNSRQVALSSRFLFGEADDFKLAREMCEECPDLRNPDRPCFETSHPVYQNSGTVRRKMPPPA